MNPTCQFCNGSNPQCPMCAVPPENFHGLTRAKLRKSAQTAGSKRAPRTVAPMVAKSPVAQLMTCDGCGGTQTSLIVTAGRGQLCARCAAPAPTPAAPPIPLIGGRPPALYCARPGCGLVLNNPRTTVTTDIGPMCLGCGSERMRKVEMVTCATCGETKPRPETLWARTPAVCIACDTADQAHTALRAAALRELRTQAAAKNYNVALGLLIGLAGGPLQVQRIRAATLIDENAALRNGLSDTDRALRRRLWAACVADLGFDPLKCDGPVAAVNRPLGVVASTPVPLSASAPQTAPRALPADSVGSGPLAGGDWKRLYLMVQRGELSTHDAEQIAAQWMRAQAS